MVTVNIGGLTQDINPVTGDPLHSRALAHSRAPLFTQPCTHCSHSRAPIVHTAVPRENNEHGCVWIVTAKPFPPSISCIAQNYRY